MAKKKKKNVKGILMSQKSPLLLHGLHQLICLPNSDSDVISRWCASSQSTQPVSGAKHPSDNCVQASTYLMFLQKKSKNGKEM